MILRIREFITTGVWQIRRKNLPRSRALIIHYLRVFILSLKGFAEDKCQLRASALTYYSLLSIVPVVAMAFGVAKGFGFEKLLEKQLIERFQGQEEVITRVIEFAQTFLENTKGGLIAGIGVLVLFWTVIKVLGNIELSFNDIWGIRKSRTLLRKFTDYLTIMLICPFLLVVSSSVTVFVASQVQLITEKIAILGVLSPLIFVVLKLLPYAVMWILFSFIYAAIPNTKVSIGSAIFAGIAGGTIYQAVQWAYITFQLGASKFGAIYGSFAALPLFLVWLQTSWLVVLFGAELSFAHQNSDTYEFEPACLSVKPSFKRLATLCIMHRFVRQFIDEKDPLTAAGISHELELPIRLVNAIIADLQKSKLLAEVNISEERISGYQPAVDPDIITVSFILERLDETGTEGIPLPDEKEFNALKKSLQEFKSSMQNSPQNVLLKAL